VVAVPIASQTRIKKKTRSRSVYNVFRNIPKDASRAQNATSPPVHPVDSYSDGPFHFKNTWPSSKLSCCLYVARHLNWIPTWLLTGFVSKLFMLFVSQMNSCVQRLAVNANLIYNRTYDYSYFWNELTPPPTPSYCLVG
jgi:hypothetical protein